MPPKKIKSPPSDPQGMFSRMVVFLVEDGVQTRRLQIWKQRLTQMGASIQGTFSKNVTHVFAVDANSLLKKVDHQRLIRSKAKVLLYQWVEDSLTKGEKVAEDLYIVSLESGENKEICKADNTSDCTNSEFTQKKSRISFEGGNIANQENKVDTKDHFGHQLVDTANTSECSSRSSSPEIFSEAVFYPCDEAAETSKSSLLYEPPNLNRNITKIFGKLVDIYRALGDDRRSFSYYKAIQVIEKLPFKIESIDQVKKLPTIGRSLQEHIQEIVNTGKLSKLQHFEKDEKVRTISLFGDVWGVGPATALKFYEKGHRTLDDLKNEESLTNAQRLGLKYFQDIKTRIPRQEVEEMDKLLQKVGQEILPGVIIVCGGSYRRGKSSCGDMDIVITHPDGKSHIGFLPRFVKRLKEMKFLREDLVFSIHSEEGTDSGVDTYFGLCTYPGQELRRRIDLKVYPRNIYAFGLVHWTGNDVVNRRLRILAQAKGFRLDDTGLFPSTQGSEGKQGGIKRANLKLDTEKEIFDFLGFPWLEPHERNL
ncbi:PREDICTED: DNA polymerase lambda isoform X1 [Ipomoea nil]|uniref:DNA polymerase lambda isoform X1 n=1 Tax=Ipomoea nil TaxID=35883 RepID=UPI000900997B|nr:PREDICTED: DNA polymerase lambda isoform X1 [Ipomoea nil]